MVEKRKHINCRCALDCGIKRKLEPKPASRFSLKKIFRSIRNLFHRKSKPKWTQKEIKLALAVNALLAGMDAIEKELGYLDCVGLDCAEKRAHEIAKRTKMGVEKALKAGEKGMPMR